MFCQRLRDLKDFRRESPALVLDGLFQYESLSDGLKARTSNAIVTLTPTRGGRALGNAEPEGVRKETVGSGLDPW